MMTTPGCDSDETSQYETGLIRSSWLSSAPTCTPQNTLYSTTISEAIRLQKRSRSSVAGPDCPFPGSPLDGLGSRCFAISLRFNSSSGVAENFNRPVQLLDLERLFQNGNWTDLQDSV